MTVQNIGGAPRTRQQERAKFASMEINQLAVGLSNQVEPSQPQVIGDKTSDIGHCISELGPFPEKLFLQLNMIRIFV